MHTYSIRRRLYAREFTALAIGLAVLLLNSALVCGQSSDLATSSVKITLNDAPITAAIAVLFKNYGRKYTIDSSATGTVTVDLQNVPFDAALQVLLSSANPPLSFTVVGDVYNIAAKIDARPPGSIIPSGADAIKICRPFRVDAKQGILWTPSGNLQAGPKTTVSGYNTAQITDLKVGTRIALNGTPADNTFQARLLAIVPPGLPDPLTCDELGTITSLVPNLTVKTANGQILTVRVDGTRTQIAVVAKATMEDLAGESGERLEWTGHAPNVDQIFLPDYSPATTYGRSSAFGSPSSFGPPPSFGQLWPTNSSFPWFVADVAKVDTMHGILWTSVGNIRVDSKTAYFRYIPAPISDLAVGTRVAINGGPSEIVGGNPVGNRYLAERVLVLLSGDPAPVGCNIEGVITSIVPALEIKTKADRTLIVDGSGAQVVELQHATVSDLINLQGAAIDATVSNGLASQIFIDKEQKP